MEYIMGIIAVFGFIPWLMYKIIVSIVIGIATLFGSDYKGP